MLGSAAGAALSLSLGLAPCMMLCTPSRPCAARPSLGYSVYLVPRTCDAARTHLECARPMPSVPHATPLDPEGLCSECADLWAVSAHGSPLWVPLAYLMLALPPFLVELHTNPLARDTRHAGSSLILTGVRWVSPCAYPSLMLGAAQFIVNWLPWPCS